MANVVKEHKIIDTQSRTLVKNVMVVDTVSANNLLVDVSNLAFSLNANGKIMSSNTHPKSIYRNTIRRIYGHASLKSGGYITLVWGGANTDSIVTIGNGLFDYNFDSMGLSASIPIQDTANSTGDILYATTGVAAGDALTIFIELKKDNRDYDAGQSRDSGAFNPTRIP